MRGSDNPTLLAVLSRAIRMYTTARLRCVFSLRRSSVRECVQVAQLNFVRDGTFSFIVKYDIIQAWDGNFQSCVECFLLYRSVYCARCMGTCIDYKDSPITYNTSDEISR